MRVNSHFNLLFWFYFCYYIEICSFVIIENYLQKDKTKLMGQQQLVSLKQQIKQGPNIDNLRSQSSFQFLKNIIEQTQKTGKQPLTPQRIQHHIQTYLESLGKDPRKRRRSYQLIKVQEEGIEDISIENSKLSQCLIIEAQMGFLQELDQQFTKNITEIMSTLKTFKIRQNFRKLILKVLNLDNLLLQIVHQNGRVEYQDFENNYITDVLQPGRHEKIEQFILANQGIEHIGQALSFFDISQQIKQELYEWISVVPNEKMKALIVWKSLSNKYTISNINKKILEKIVNVCLISTFEEENSVIQNYSKDLLDILELLIRENQLQTCRHLNSQFDNIYQIQEKLMKAETEQTSNVLLTRVRAFQQLQFELLQRIRMYKKYVCEADKIFLDFDQQACLVFVTNNFTHKTCNKLGKLYQKQKLFIQNIFNDHKVINDFLKKAVQKKIKQNKLYELDFETKARIKYGDEGRIIRIHVIIQQLQTSSSQSSTNIYSSSSTKILSDQSSKKSEKEISNEQQKDVRHSTLVKNLEKQNPGIIDQGWINLFIKDHHITPKNTHLKHKGGKSYTVKRSYSLNRQQFVTQAEESLDVEVKQKLSNINIDSTDLNLLQLQEQFLQPFVLKVFKRLEHFTDVNINKQYFENFLTDLHNGYQIHNNPFHNFTHGVNVMHTCYLLCNTSRTKHLLTPFKMFTIVFSGLCHDVGHTGFTNLFQIASQSKKAINYNDSSPLENYHAAYTFELLKKPQNNFLKGLSVSQMKEFRKSVISNILYTDIKEHFPLLKKFNSILTEQLTMSQQYLTVLSAVIVHTSDFGGSAKEFEISKQWSLKVNLQFSNQYKMEGQLGLPQTPFMKDLTNIHILSKNQGGFLKVIVFPLYQALDQFNNNDNNMRRLKQHVQNNIKEWEIIHHQALEEKLAETKQQEE